MKLYRNDIYKLQDAGEEAYFELFKDPDNLSVDQLITVYRCTLFPTRSTDRFKQTFVPLFLDAFAKETAAPCKYGYFSYTRLHNIIYPQFLLYHLEEFGLSAEQQKKLTDTCLNNRKHFSSQAKRMLGDICCRFADEHSAITILQALSRTLSKKTLRQLIEKIPGGLNHPDVVKLLKKENTLKFLVYTKEMFDSDPAKKQEIIHAICKTPTLRKKIDFPVTMTFEDLKNIAPAMRFRFLQLTTELELRYTRYGYTGHALWRNIAYYKNKIHDNLVLPLLTEEQINDLLFSVSLNKNDRVASFVSLYKRYVDALKVP